MERLRGDGDLSLVHFLVSLFCILLLLKNLALPVTRHPAKRMELFRMLPSVHLVLL